MSAIKEPVAVRNVVLVTGYDYENPARSFDEVALARVLDLFDQGEHLRYPLRFHLLSAASGLSAESVVFDKSYPMNSAVEGNLRALERGAFWLRVEQRFAPVKRDHYPVRNVFVEPPAKPQTGKRVLSITDVYRYLYSFWEAAQQTSRNNLVAYDSLVELSFFCHAALDSVRLVNSADRKRGLQDRDPNDKDGRVKDFDKGKRGDLWKGIAAVFDRAAGRVRIWGGDEGADALYYRGLIRAALAARQRAVQGSLATPAPALSDADRVQVTDPQVRDRLGSGADQLTWGDVKKKLDEGRQASYAAGVQKALQVPTYTTPLGASATPERTLAGRVSRRLLLAVPKDLDDIVQFHQAHLRLELDPDGRRYAVLGTLRKTAASKGGTTSPLAGLRLFEVYDAPFAVDKKTGLIQRDLTLQTALTAAIGTSFDDVREPERRPAIVIADVSGPARYAATLNDTLPYFSGSILKVAALFAACRLREVVRELAAKLKDLPAREIFGLLAPYLDATIDRAVDFSRAKVLKRNARGDASDLPSLAWKYRVPTYGDLFKGQAPPWEISTGQEKNVETIFQIPGASNAAAKALIHSLGYGWINGVMRASGFPGVWLAGDYSRSTDWPGARIPARTFGLAAQVTTAQDMAALFATIARQSHEEAVKTRSWLGLGVGREWTDLTGRARLPAGFQFLGVKIGETPYKVYSEGTIITQQGSARKFIAVWLNGRDDKGQVDTVLAILRETIVKYLEYLKPPP
jgi:hypothetical protein